MRPESGPPAREKRGGGADLFLSRQSSARPIPTRVGVRRPGSATLPPALAPHRVQFRWKLVWDESVEALIPAARPEPVFRTAPTESGTSAVPRFAMLERPHVQEPEKAPRSTLTRLDLTLDDVEERQAAEAATGTMDPPRPSGASRPWLKWVAGVMVILGLGGGYLHFSTRGSENAAKQTGSRGRRASGAMLPVGAPIQMTPSGWRNMPAGDTTGMGVERRFSLYRTVAPMTDYIVEFNGHILSKSLGWVVRVSDSKNYYGMRLELAKSGPDERGRTGSFRGGGRRTGRGEVDPDSGGDSQPDHEGARGCGRAAHHDLRRGACRGLLERHATKRRDLWIHERQGGARGDPVRARIQPGKHGWQLKPADPVR